MLRRSPPTIRLRLFLARKDQVRWFLLVTIWPTYPLLQQASTQVRDCLVFDGSLQIPDNRKEDRSPLLLPSGFTAVPQDSLPSPQSPPSSYLIPPPHHLPSLISLLFILSPNLFTLFPPLLSIISLSLSCLSSFLAYSLCSFASPTSPTCSSYT